jgi:hypothetical protein
MAQIVAAAGHATGGRHDERGNRQRRKRPQGIRHHRGTHLPKAAWAARAGKCWSTWGCPAADRMVKGYSVACASKAVPGIGGHNLPSRANQLGGAA